MALSAFLPWPWFQVFGLDLGVGLAFSVSFGLGLGLGLEHTVLKTLVINLYLLKVIKMFSTESIFERFKINVTNSTPYW